MSDNKGNIEVRRIEAPLTYEFILEKHYAQRMPGISFAYGLFIDNKLEGILTIGKPASNTLCESICGKEYRDYVFELNRLCTNEGLPKNTLSQFVSKVLKSLSREEIILVSYADEGMNHHGYIYQATNWIYTGKTPKRRDTYAPEGKHSRSAKAGEYPHLRQIRTAKYRYIYVPNKRFKKKVLKALKFPILEYPKGNNSRYKFGEKQKKEVLDLRTGKTYYENN
jgi:hypothetical protein